VHRALRSGNPGASSIAEVASRYGLRGLSRFAANDDFKYRFTDQPNGWFGGTVKVDWPILVNLRLDPFERTNLSQPVMAAN
jgi:arylsulfatase